MNLDDIITHQGEEREKYFNAVAPPIIQSSNFVFDSIQDMRDAIANEMHHHVYTRGNNPTVEILRKKVAALEKAEDALIVSSGATAIAAAVLSNLEKGDHIICVQKPYSWTYKLISQFLNRFGVSHDFVDGRSIKNIKEKIKDNTKVLFLESPNSLTFELQDLEACSHLAKAHSITTIIDNSHCSPIFQNPIDYGVDIVVHSGTKYINGHSDVVVGVICSSKKNIEKIFHSEYMTLGMNISPHDAALVIRGIRTLPIRVKQSDQTAKILVERLESHPKVEKVIYPFSKSFPQYDLAKKQMKGNGGLLTLALKASSKEEVYTFCDSIKRFLIAVSWGGYESLMIPSITFHDMPNMEDSPIPWNYIRFYVGLEDVEYLWEDFENAFKQINSY